jgi:hypothetical protein
MNSPFPLRAKEHRREFRRRRKATAVAAALLVAFHLVALFAAPEHLPLLIQRLVGLTGAALAGLVVVFGINETAGRVPLFRLPGRCEIDAGAIAGFAVFLLVLAWWFSPFAPITVDRPPADAPVAAPE